jgi:hypothetical protein
VLENKRKITFLAVAVLALVLGVVIGWRMRSTPPGLEKFVEYYEKEIASQTPKADGEKLEFSHTTLLVGEVELPLTTVKNLRGALGLSDCAQAGCLAAVNTMQDGSKRTVLWGSPTGPTIEFNWRERTARPVKMKAADKGRFYLSPAAVPFCMRDNPRWQVGPKGAPKLGGEFFLKTTAGEKIVKQPEHVFYEEAYFWEQYRFAVTIKREAGKETQWLSLIDMERLDFAAEWLLPATTQGQAPLFILDPTTDLLQCFDAAMSWMVCLDLQKGVKHGAKPWPPPWPHPALGEWRGNEDIRRGRYKQWHSGMPIPQKPADYP